VPNQSRGGPSENLRHENNNNKYYNKKSAKLLITTSDRCSGKTSWKLLCHSKKMLGLLDLSSCAITQNFDETSKYF